MGSASPRSGWKQMDSQLMERAEAAEMELLKSILHSLPPIRCAVIGVRVTGRPNLPPRPHHLPTHPFLQRGGGLRDCLCCSGSREKTSAVGAYELEEKSPYLPTAQFSVGAVGGYRGDPSTPSRSRWPGRHCHLSPKKPACVTLESGCYPDCKSMWGASLYKMVDGISSHLLRRYIWRLGGEGVGCRGYKSQPSWRLRPVLEEQTHKHSGVRLIQADWMSACRTPGKGNETSIIQQKDGENLWQKLQQIAPE